MNFEAAVELRFALPEESAVFDEILSMFVSLLPAKCPATAELTPAVLAELDANEMLLDEAKKGKKWGASSAKKCKNGNTLPIKPPSSIPPKITSSTGLAKKALVKQAESINAQAKIVDVLKPFVPVGGLAIQITPHENGEIHLSTTAIKQNPAFFGIPFSGWSTPKLSKNKPYPQRIPDPICRITVFGKNDQELYFNAAYALNTILYTTNSEIRITASPLVDIVPAYSVLVMTLSPVDEIDYEMNIFTPESPSYAAWVAACNQVMPSGGKDQPRRFGWF